MQYATKICLNEKSDLLNQDKKASFLLVYYFLIFLGIAFIRSLGSTDNISLYGVDITQHFILIGSYILIVVPLIWIVSHTRSAIYLFGASPALGILPEFPGLPFLREFSHLMVFISLIAFYRARSKTEFTYWRANQPLLAYASFWVVSLIGVILNFFLLGSFWQFKLGVSALFMVGAYLAMLSLLADGSVSQKITFDRMLDGFIHSTLILAVIGLIVTSLLFLIPYSTGTNGLGNNTIYGLGYFDRMQLLFPGPVYAGIYFAIAICLVIYKMVIGKKDSHFFYFFTVRTVANHGHRIA